MAIGITEVIGIYLFGIFLASLYYRFNKTAAMDAHLFGHLPIKIFFWPIQYLVFKMPQPMKKLAAKMAGVKLLKL